MLCSLTLNTCLLPQDLDLLSPVRPSQWTSPPCLNALQAVHEKNVTCVLHVDERINNDTNTKAQWTAWYLVQTSVPGSLGN